jgi:hypothetical protein
MCRENALIIFAAEGPVVTRLKVIANISYLCCIDVDTPNKSADHKLKTLNKFALAVVNRKN